MSIEVKEGERRWPVLLLRTSPTWVGILLSWIGLAILLGSALVIILFVVAFAIFALVALNGRRRTESEQPRMLDPQARRRATRDSYVFAVGAILIAVVVPVFLGISTGSVLFSLGSLLMVLGSFETRRMLRQGRAEIDPAMR